jgi:hypothetical protein
MAAGSTARRAFRANARAPGANPPRDSGKGRGRLFGEGPSAASAFRKSSWGTFPAQIDLALADAAKRREELRQMKSLEPWKVLLSGITALGAWSAFLVFLIAHWWK